MPASTRGMPVWPRCQALRCFEFFFQGRARTPAQRLSLSFAGSDRAGGRRTRARSARSGRWRCGPWRLARARSVGGRFRRSADEATGPTLRRVAGLVALLFVLPLSLCLRKRLSREWARVFAGLPALRPFRAYHLIAWHQGEQSSSDALCGHFDGGFSLVGAQRVATGSDRAPAGA